MADTCTSRSYNKDNNKTDNDHDHEQQQQHSIIKYSMSTPLYKLQHVFDQYKSHPELLKLILTSKVEEDKRRAEEAKLRSKELDCYMKSDSAPPSPSQCVNLPTATANSPQQPKMPISSAVNGSNNKRRLDPSGPYLIHRSHHRYHRHIKMTPNKKHSVYHQQQRRHSAATAMLAMGSSDSPTLPTPTLPHKTSHMHSGGGDEERDTSKTLDNYASPMTEDHTMDQDEGKPRRRREMLTKIVETRDFPYVDNYFWRNNGNTTQKRTGCRSIYYKCSNSTKGCQVNKTVTATQNGVYLIKYRGNHMAECGMVERVCDL